MEEYFNINLGRDYTLSDPTQIDKKTGVLECCYKTENPSPITIISPPLRCSKIKVGCDKNTGKLTKCYLECEVTTNEWRFTQFLDDLKETSCKIIDENGEKWFGIAYSDSMLDSYTSLYLEQNNHNEHQVICIKLGKELIKKLTKHQIKEFRNKYLIFQLSFTGFLVKKGSFTELWRSHDIFKAQPVKRDDTDDSDDDMDDIEKVIELEKKKEKKKSKREHNKVEKKIGNELSDGHKKAGGNQVKNEADNENELSDENKAIADVVGDEVGNEVGDVVDVVGDEVGDGTEDEIIEAERNSKNIKIVGESNVKLNEDVELESLKLRKMSEKVGEIKDIQLDTKRRTKRNKPKKLKKDKLKDKVKKREIILFNNRKRKW